MRYLAYWLRRVTDRIDHAGAPKLMHWSFTFKEGQGIVFRKDGRSCPLAYLGDDAYERAHTEAVPVSNGTHEDFDKVRVCYEVSPGGVMIIPPQAVTIKITGLAEGGCRVETRSAGFQIGDSVGVTFTNCTFESPPA